MLLDVTRAFPHAKLSERLFIELPKGFQVEGKVGLLHQALEGLKQSANLWQDLLSTVLKKIGFTRSTVDPNLYILSDTDVFIMIIVWVDDLACGPNNPAKMDKVIGQIKKEINLKVVDMDTFVGLQIDRNRKERTLTLKQTRYVDALVGKHRDKGGIKAWKHFTPSGTSMPEIKRFMNLETSKNESEKQSVLRKGYLEILGALLWTACMTSDVSCSSRISWTRATWFSLLTSNLKIVNFPM